MTEKFVYLPNIDQLKIMNSFSRILCRVCCVALVASACSFEALAWHREGHETIAAVADLNLKPSTRRIVEKYLGGHSIIYYAKWMDQVRKLPQYAYTDKWHCANVDKDCNYIPSRDGDPVHAIELAMETLKDYKHLPDSVVAFNIKCLLHFVGDLHCPSHVYFNGRAIPQKVTIKDNEGHKKAYSFHAIWDFALIRANRIMSSTEWAAELDGVLTKRQKKEMASGTPREWLADCVSRNVHFFEWMTPEAEVPPCDPMFVINGMQLIETNISYAGVRLASVLNSIFP